MKLKHETSIAALGRKLVAGEVQEMTRPCVSSIPVQPSSCSTWGNACDQVSLVSSCALQEGRLSPCVRSMMVW